MRLEILLFLAIISVNSAKTDEDNKVFVATREWKDISEGQAIPPGLHIRINLQTGKKEAKLLDADANNDDKSSAIAIAPASEDENTEDHPELVPESIHSRLKDALKNIPDEGFEYSEEKVKEITKKFKSYESIKREFAEMNMEIKTDFEIMSDLFGKYDMAKGEHDLNQFRALFEDLEYLLHQIDNANDFVTAGGLEKVILPNLGNQSIPELRVYSVKLLGVLVQNNPKGQVAAFERNVGSVLLQMLSQTSSSRTIELSSIIFAIGGLLRKFPLAQVELLNNPGLNVLVDLLGKKVDFKIKMKCLLLIADLIRDSDEVDGDVDFTRAKQYNAAGIKGRLSKTEYCTVLVELFSAHRQDYLESFYVAEDILNALIASKEICEPQWIESSVLRHTLLVIVSNYDRMKNQSNFDESEVSEIIDKLEHLQQLFSNHTVVNDEL